MNSGIDLLRHLFAAAVIAQHMTSASRYSIATNLELARVVNWIDGAVIGFFLISGFLFKAPNSIWVYYKKQAVRLLVPFFIFSIIYSIALAVIGKGSFVDGLAKTATLQGAGMQLYYLPYLLLVTVVYATVEQRLRLNREISLCLLAVSASGIAFMLPTASSTGSDIQLIPFYFCAFLTGSFIAERAKRNLQVQTVSFVVALAVLAGLKDARFFDLAGVVGIFGVTLMLAPFMPNKRLPGSGGIYLLHTPITNFAISTILVAASITQGANIVASIVLTYVLCLAITLLAIKLFPTRRWLILE